MGGASTVWHVVPACVRAYTCIYVPCGGTIVYDVPWLIKRRRGGCLQQGG